jgi:hypothetical protein
MDILQANNAKQLRAAILGILYDNQRAQRSRLRMVMLNGALEKLFFEITPNDLITVLQDLKERGYATFKEGFANEDDRRAGRRTLGEIQILPAGRDLVERTKTDMAVQFD